MRADLLLGLSTNGLQQLRRHALPSSLDLSASVSHSLHIDLVDFAHTHALQTLRRELRVDSSCVCLCSLRHRRPYIETPLLLFLC